jgi:hypothetical protein
MEVAGEPAGTQGEAVQGFLRVRGEVRAGELGHLADAGGRPSHHILSHGVTEADHQRGGERSKGTAEHNVIFSDNVDAPGRLGPTTSARGLGGYAYFAATSPFRALSTPLVVGFGHTM